MRIAVVMTGGLHPSGREQVIPVYLGLFGRIATRHEVHAFVVRHLRAPATYDLAGITVHDLGRPAARAGLARLAQWRALRRAMHASGRFDLVHGIWADPAGLLAAAVGRRLGIPSVVSCTSGEFVDEPDMRYGLQRLWHTRAIVRAACDWASAVHVASRYAAAQAERLGQHTVTIPIGVDVAPAVAGRAEGPPWRLLQVASLNRVKDQARLIDAVAELAPGLDVQVDLVGEDTLGGVLQARAAAAGVDRRITFHGVLPADAVAPLRAAAHLYVQTSRHEGAGVAVLEAAAAGLPIVGTPVGYLADWAPDAACAVPETSPAALAAAITALVASRERRETLAAAARRFALAHDADWSAHAIVGLYEGLAGGASQRWP
jgi:glycosyltransferase involved in cell wall biosynthesis